jgi:outer membrane protein OmpA-like peptidoglycan-associated protein
LERLRGLLLLPKRGALESLQQRLDDPQLRARELARVLPTALHLGSDQGPGLSEALQQPVERAIRRTVKKDTQMFADALYPVIGPAIRRSISEALRALLQNLNRTLDQSFSLEGLSWRIEAWRTGVPFHQIVLRNTLIYRVEQVFLIHRESGLLIQHLARADVETQDADAVSAMLTAIEDFVKDSFTGRNGDGGEALDTVDLGDYTLWLIHGPKALLACAIRGMPPAELRGDFQEVLERVHRLYGAELDGFAEAQTPLEAARPSLEDCLVSETKEHRRRLFSWPLILGLLLLAGGLAWFAYQAGQERGRQARLAAALAAEPGIRTLEIGRADGRLQVRGLRDPLSADPVAIARLQGYKAEELKMSWEPMQLLHPRLNLRRAQQALQPPAEVALTLRGGMLHASGSAPTDWIERARALAPVLPGIEGLDASDLVSADQRLLELLRQRLEPPDSLQLQVQNGVLRASGNAPLAWLEQAQGQLDGVPGLRGHSFDGVSSDEALELASLLGQLPGPLVYFEANDATIPDVAEPILRQLARKLQRLQALADQLGRRFEFRLIGRADGTGPADRNRELALQRASSLRIWLAAAGVDKNRLLVDGAVGHDQGGDSSERRMLRRVDLQIRSSDSNLE